jgi:hypothetical protein
MDVKKLLSHCPIWCVRHTNYTANGAAHALSSCMDEIVCVEQFDSMNLALLSKNKKKRNRQK